MLRSFCYSDCQEYRTNFTICFQFTLTGIENFEWTLKNRPSWWPHDLNFESTRKASVATLDKIFKSYVKWQAFNVMVSSLMYQIIYARSYKKITKNDFILLFLIIILCNILFCFDFQNMSFSIDDFDNWKDFSDWVDDNRPPLDLPIDWVKNNWKKPDCQLDSEFVSLK